MKADRRVTGISEMFDGLAARNVCGIQNFLRNEYSNTSYFEITFSVRVDEDLDATLMQCHVHNLLGDTTEVVVLVYPDGKFFVYPKGSDGDAMTELAIQFPGLRMDIPTEFNY